MSQYNSKDNIVLDVKEFAIRNNETLFEEHIPTGFPLLDEKLNGGLTPSVTVLGGPSGTGKSTFLIQLAYNFADQGYPVLYFSLEMRRKNIIAKNLSRLTFEYCQDERLAKSDSSLLKKEVMTNLSDPEFVLVKKAVDNLSTVGENLYILDRSSGPWNITNITTYVHQFVAQEKKNPIVIIDYLQIIEHQANGKTLSDKQIVDVNIGALCTLSEVLNIPVIAISSYNRESYDTKASFKAFCSSSSIEYSADLLLSISFEGAGQPNFDEQAARAELNRKIEITILKQRYGQAGISIGFEYKPVFNYMQETKIKSKMRKAI